MIDPADNTTVEAADAPPPVQFNLLRLLAVVTGAGVLFGLWRADLQAIVPGEVATFLRVVTAFLSLGLISFNSGFVGSQRFPIINFIPAFLGGLATVTAIGCAIGAVALGLRMRFDG